MGPEPIHVLVVEDDPEDVMFVGRYLAAANEGTYVIESCGRLNQALEILRQKLPHVVLLDVALPDSMHQDTFLRLHGEFPNVPIIILTGLDEKSAAIEAIRGGAQDYLVKGHIDGKLLARSITYAIERGRLQMEVKALSLTDHLTGLYNRRGFYLLCEQQLKIHARTERELTLFFMDVDGLKNINDTAGHSAGDKVLVESAKIFNVTFRRSDIIGRVGGDEFAVLAVESSQEHAQAIIARLLENIKVAGEAMGMPLGLSVGYVTYNGKSPADIEMLLSHADRAMYEQRRQQRTG